MNSQQTLRLIKTWLKENNFRCKSNSGAVVHEYLRTWENCYLLINFYCDRFGSRYYFSVGFKFDNVENGVAYINVRNLPSNLEPQGIPYGDKGLPEYKFWQCLEEMFEKYIEPYISKGIIYLKEIGLGYNDNVIPGEYYQIFGGARQKLNEMFDLNITE